MRKAVERASVTRANTNGSDYTYRKVNVTEEFDSSGHVKQRKQRAFQVYYRDGTTQVRLVEVNGHPPDPADLKFQAQTQSSVHQFFGQPAAGGDNRESFLTSEIAARFNFVLGGECSMNGRPTYRVTFQPKDQVPPAYRTLDQVLKRISGTLWIDAQEFEIARADLKLGSEVDFLGGVIGCLRKLAYTMTRSRMADGIWLLSFSAGDFEGRKLLDSIRIKMRSESTNFRLMAENK
jgi:hypothetical protein